MNRELFGELGTHLQVTDRDICLGIGSPIDLLNDGRPSAVLLEVVIHHGSEREHHLLSDFLPAYLP